MKKKIIIVLLAFISIESFAFKETGYCSASLDCWQGTVSCNGQVSCSADVKAGTLTCDGVTGTCSAH